MSNTTVTIKITIKTKIVKAQAPRGDRAGLVQKPLLSPQVPWVYVSIFSRKSMFHQILKESVV